MENPRIVAQETTEDGLEKIDVEMNVPAKQVERPSLLLRIRFFFERGFQMTGEILASIQTAVQRIANDINTIVAAQYVLRDLRALHPGLKGIELRLSRESKDILLVHLNHRIEREHHSGQPA